MLSIFDESGRETVNNAKEEFERVFIWVGVVLFFLLFIVVGLQMLTRWFLNPYLEIPLPWTAGLSQMLLVWITFLGAALASKRREHVSIDLLFKFIPTTLGRFIGIVQLLTIIVFLVVFIDGAMKRGFSSIGTQYHVLPVIPPFSRGWLYFIPAIGCVLMIVYSLRDVYIHALVPDTYIYSEEDEEIEVDEEEMARVERELSEERGDN